MVHVKEIPPDKLRWSQRGGQCSCRVKGAEWRRGSLLRWSTAAHVDSLTESYMPAPTHLKLLAMNLNSYGPDLAMSTE